MILTGCFLRVNGGYLVASSIQTLIGLLLLSQIKTPHKRGVRYQYKKTLVTHMVFHLSEK